MRVFEKADKPGNPKPTGLSGTICQYGVGYDEILGEGYEIQSEHR